LAPAAAAATTHTRASVRLDITLYSYYWLNKVDTFV
jgi:hypothetical protein